jgi:6-phosphogluconolactonase
MAVFSDSGALADAAAALLAEALAGAAPRSLVITGGRSPGAVYDRLAGLDLAWSAVTVTLSDDRWVDPASPLSNEGLARERLLTGRASAARFLPLKGEGDTPEADARAAEPWLSALAPFSAVLLGMGEDGHIASLFPGDPDRLSRLDPDGARWCVGVAEAGLEPFVPRISLTVRALLDSRLVVLLITGEAKRALIERVRADPVYDPPVAAILRQTRAPVRVLWAP